jgi:hypothetical protein
MTPAPASPRWLLFFHQLPPQPASLRVKVWRRLSTIGAVQLKNSVYALPNTDAAREDLQWLLQEIGAEGGEGTVCQATLIDGLTDDQVVALFQEARAADYREFAEQAGKLERLPATAALADQVARLRRRLGEIVAIDFFSAPARESAEAQVDGLERRVRSALEPVPGGAAKTSRYRGRAWATRSGVFIDRIASAWLIRRFIDAQARFRFIERDGGLEHGEIGFDLAGGEFTHVGERCTFEVLVEHFGLGEAAIRHLAEVIHDLDIKDGRYARPETDGIAVAIRGITLVEQDDAKRLELGRALFDQLLAALRHQHVPPRKARPAAKAKKRR